MIKTTLALAFLVTALNQPLHGAVSNEGEVRQTIEAFYRAFNSHDFSHIAEFTADEWVHIIHLAGSKVVEQLFWRNCERFTLRS